MYTAFSAVAIVCEAVIIGLYIAFAVRRRKFISDKIYWYALAEYVLMYVLYTVGYAYSGRLWSVPVIFKLFSVSATSFVFGIGLDYILLLAAENATFAVAVTFAFILAPATLAGCVALVFRPAVECRRKLRSAVEGGREFVLGCNEQALKYAAENQAVVLAPMPWEQRRSLSAQGYCVVNKSLSSDGCAKFFKRNIKAGVTYHFVAFDGCESSYTALIDSFVKAFSVFTDSGFVLHIEASFAEMDVINRKFAAQKRPDNIIVTCFDRYELTARKFVAEEPISKYLPRSFYGKYYTVLPDKKINVVFLGFGRDSYELAKLMIIQNRFVGINGKKFRNHPVNYYFYGNAGELSATDIGALLGHGYDKMRSYALPKPEPICSVEEAEECNVTSDSILNKLDGIVCDKNSFTYIVVSFGSDCRNVAYAELLENNYSDGANVKIFASVKDNAVAGENRSGVICFGAERAVLCTDVIVDDSLGSLAASDKRVYSDSVRAQFAAFNKRSVIENCFASYNALSVFFKINLLECDYVMRKRVTDKSRILSRDGLKKICSEKEESGKNGYEAYFDLGVRNMLGFSEHSRRTAQYILAGFGQMNPEEMNVAVTEDKDGQKSFSLGYVDYSRRLYARLTDYYSLNGYHEYAINKLKEAGKEYVTMEEVETYAEVTCFIDEGYDEMSANGYVLVKK